MGVALAALMVAAMVGGAHGIMSAAEVEALEAWKAAGPDFSSSMGKFTEAAGGGGGAFIFGDGAVPATQEQARSFFDQDCGGQKCSEVKASAVNAKAFLIPDDKCPLGRNDDADVCGFVLLKQQAGFRGGGQGGTVPINGWQGGEADASTYNHIGRLCAGRYDGPSDWGPEYEGAEEDDGNLNWWEQNCPCVCAVWPRTTEDSMSGLLAPPRAKCLTLECPDDTKHQKSARQASCKAPICNLDDDVDKCCVVEPASCDTATCPHGWQLFGDAASKVCENSKCVTDDSLGPKGVGTDTEACCEETAKCDSMRSPRGYMLKDNAADIFCTTFFCAHSLDRDTCCDVKPCPASEHCLDFASPPDMGLCTDDHLSQHEPYCSNCEIGRYADVKPPFGTGKCLECFQIPHTTPDPIFTCAIGPDFAGPGDEDSTLAQGTSCEYGYWHRSIYNHNDRCEPCAAIDNCVDVSCSTGHNSVCQQCAEGFTGARCQHSLADSQCNGNGDVIIVGGGQFKTNVHGAHSYDSDDGDCHDDDAAAVALGPVFRVEGLTGCSDMIVFCIDERFKAQTVEVCPQTCGACQGGAWAEGRRLQAGGQGELDHLISRVGKIVGTAAEGDHSEHDDAAAHAKTDRSTTKCVCDDGYSGDKCEIAATCDVEPVADGVVAPAEIATYFRTGKTACEADGAMGTAKCLLGCEKHFYLVTRVEGLCTADVGAITASYKGQAAECSPCSPMARCNGPVTCMSAIDSECWANDCERGYVGPKCEPCPAGTIFSDATKKCEQCGAGTYTPSAGMDECVPCEAGWYAPQTGAIECNICGVGRYSGSDGAHSCTPCPEGTINQIQGQTECVSCPEGLWSSAGTTECHGCDEVFACESDVTCTTAGDSKCSDCATGYFVDADGTCSECTQVDNCVLGASVCSGAGDSTCTNCIGSSFYGENCDACTAIEHCVRETCSDANNARCEMCEEGFKTNDAGSCEVDIPPFDAVCYTKGVYGDDGADAPDNSGERKTDTYKKCQVQCERDEKCFLWSWNEASTDCVLKSFDAGCGGDAGCTEGAAALVEADGKNGKATSDAGYVSGPKACNRADCSQLDCPAGWAHDMAYMNRKASVLKCKLGTCTIENDLDTCCEPATCGTWTCPPYYLNKVGCSYVDGVEICADDVKCSNAEGQAYGDVVKSISGDDALGQFQGKCTKEDDLDACCAGKATCDSLDCGDDYTHTTDGLHISKKACKGAACTLADDRDYCCMPKATCQRDYECPVNSKSVDKSTGNVRFIDFVTRPSTSVLYCERDFCDEANDRDTCCVQRADCESYECPSGYATSAWAVKTQIACVGYVCTESADLDRCCFPIKQCDTMIANSNGATCPDSYVPKPNQGQIDCASNAGRCDVRVDLEACCDPKETCDEMRPELFDCAAVNDEFGVDGCDGDCVKDRCESSDASCAWTTGPPGMWNKYLGGFDDDNEPIGSGACGWKECHREWNGCVCPQGLDEWGSVEQMRGGFFKPGMGGQASSAGFSGDIYEAQCVVTEMWSGDDRSEKCPTGQVAIPGATEEFCSEGHCTVGNDAASCCVARATCDTMLEAKEGYALVANAADVSCAASVCDVEVDTEVCSEPRASCSALECAAGSMSRTGDDLFCETGQCGDADQETCCSQCPTGHASSGGADCEACEPGKYSSEGFEASGSDSCEDCGRGRFSERGFDHCQDCTAIFACASKTGMGGDERRRLDETEGSLTCTGPDTAICDKCVQGFFGDGTESCTMCTPIENCAFRAGNADGPSCTNPNDQSCGVCKAGYHGAKCEPCPEVPNCIEGKLSCENASAGKCTECEGGYYLDAVAGSSENGKCFECSPLDNCAETSCTEDSGSTCTRCNKDYHINHNGTCSKLTFLARQSLWIYEV